MSWTTEVDTRLASLEQDLALLVRTERNDLRDRFAMAALTGLSDRLVIQHTADRQETRWIAEAAYAVSDAMLAARERKPE